MNKLLEKLGKTLATLLLPIVVAQLTKAVEEVINHDINGDGRIGFADPAVPESA